MRVRVRLKKRRKQQALKLFHKRRAHSRKASPPPFDWSSYTPKQSVSAILSVQNEEDSLEMVLKELCRIPVQEIILVMNGCTDNSIAIAEQFQNTKILNYSDPIGHDIGRALGASIAASDILLFVDGDIATAAEHLKPFVHAIEQGMDVALNDISPYIPSPFDRRDDLSRCKEFLNRVLGRRDLSMNSMTAVPHAMSRHAVEIIDYKNLMVPPKAQAMAIMKGLRIGTCTSVDVVRSNRVRSTNVGSFNPVSQLIIGDHLEAIRAAIEQREGNRLTLRDTQRKRIAASRNSG